MYCIAWYDRCNLLICILVCILALFPQILQLLKSRTTFTFSCLIYNSLLLRYVEISDFINIFKTLIKQNRFVTFKLVDASDSVEKACNASKIITIWLTTTELQGKRYIGDVNILKVSGFCFAFGHLAFLFCSDDSAFHNFSCSYKDKQYIFPSEFSSFFLGPFFAVKDKQYIFSSS